MRNFLELQETGSLFLGPLIAFVRNGPMGLLIAFLHNLEQLPLSKPLYLLGQAVFRAGLLCLSTFLKHLLLVFVRREGPVWEDAW